MRENLASIIQELRTAGWLDSLDEQAIKQTVILRILHSQELAWNTYNRDEVWPEYPVATDKVDYSLRHSNANKVFVEVKAVREKLDDHQGQLLKYSFGKGVRLAVLTNGMIWWFYLPLHAGDWEKRKFCTINIYDQQPDEIVNRLTDYLSKDNVVTEKAVENAESAHKREQMECQIRDTLPEAWNKIISAPDELLIDLIAEHTEKLCGYKPVNATVKQFIVLNINKVEKPREAEWPKIRTARQKGTKIHKGRGQPVRITLLDGNVKTYQLAKAACDDLHIEVGGDAATRKLDWAKKHRIKIKDWERI